MSKSPSSPEATNIRNELIPLIYTKKLTGDVLNHRINKLSPDDKIYVLAQLMIRSLVIESDFKDILQANLSAVIAAKAGSSTAQAKSESERVITEINKKAKTEEIKQKVLEEAAKELYAEAPPKTKATEVEATATKSAEAPPETKATEVAPPQALSEATPTPSAEPPVSTVAAASIIAGVMKRFTASKTKERSESLENERLFKQTIKDLIFTGVTTTEIDQPLSKITSLRKESRSAIIEEGIIIAQAISNESINSHLNEKLAEIHSNQGERTKILQSIDARLKREREAISQEYQEYIQEEERRRAAEEERRRAAEEARLAAQKKAEEERISQLTEEYKTLYQSIGSSSSSKIITKLDRLDEVTEKLAPEIRFEAIEGISEELTKKAAKELQISRLSQRIETIFSTKTAHASGIGLTDSIAKTLVAIKKFDEEAFPLAIKKAYKLAIDNDQPKIIEYLDQQISDISEDNPSKSLEISKEILEYTKTKLTAASASGISQASQQKDSKHSSKLLALYENVISVNKKIQEEERSKPSISTTTHAATAPTAQASTTTAQAPTAPASASTTTAQAPASAPKKPSILQRIKNFFKNTDNSITVSINSKVIKLNQKEPEFLKNASKNLTEKIKTSETAINDSAKKIVERFKNALTKNPKAVQPGSTSGNHNSMSVRGGRDK